MTAPIVPEDEPNSIFTQCRSDQFFTLAQITRLADLMQRLRDARAAGGALPEAEWAELEALIEAELLASTQRAELLLQEQERLRERINAAYTDPEEDAEAAQEEAALAALRRSAIRRINRLNSGDSY